MLRSMMVAGINVENPYKFEKLATLTTKLKRPSEVSSLLKVSNIGFKNLDAHQKYPLKDEIYNLNCS